MNCGVLLSFEEATSLRPGQADTASPIAKICFGGPSIMAERWGDEMEYFKIVLPAQEDEICVEMCTSQQVKLTS